MKEKCLLCNKTGSSHETFLSLRNVHIKCCHLLFIPWCHSSSGRAVALANDSHEISSKPSETYWKLSADGDWVKVTHIHNIYTTRQACPDTQSNARSTECRLSLLPADITFLWSAPCFTLARSLCGSDWAVNWARLKVILLKGGIREGNLELWLGVGNQTWSWGILGLG